jgi:hypothetical protein
MGKSTRGFFILPPAQAATGDTRQMKKEIHGK